MMFHYGSDHHIWTYCLHLGPWTYEGQNFDLGILHNPERFDHLSLAVVTGPECSEYVSGDTYLKLDPSFGLAYYMRQEVIKRYEAYLKGGD